jgi:hypothetical protein
LSTHAFTTNLTDSSIGANLIAVKGGATDALRVYCPRAYRLERIFNGMSAPVRELFPHIIA